MRRVSYLLFHSILVSISILLTTTQPLHAASFTVNDNGDTGDANPGNGVCATVSNSCTLRAAIEEANARAGADTITIPAMTITLGTLLTINESVGNINDISINGAGQGLTIIDGNHTTRVFYFKPRSGNHRLSGLTIRNARVTDTSDPIQGDPLGVGNGGAILNEATLTIANTTIANNQAEQGAGIHNMFAFTDGSNNLIIPTLTLDSVTIRDNTAASTNFGEGGGGLFNGGRLDGNEVTISGNTALQGGGYYHNSRYPATLTDFVIDNNSAKYGGGIDNDFAPSGGITLSNGTISNNVTSNATGDPPTGGGGIYNNDGIMTLTNVTISGNSNTSRGGYGGGIFNLAVMVLTKVAISGNSATYGAGIYNGGPIGPIDEVNTNAMTLVNSTISGNIGQTIQGVSAVGGGLYNANVSRIGGGSFSSNGLKLTNVTITGNSAVFGGGIYDLPTNNTVTLENTILAGNTATSIFVGVPKGPDCGGTNVPIGTINSMGNNIIGNSEGCLFLATGTDQLNVDPLLFPLQNNGGATSTHALQPGSPAIDRGNNNVCPTTDQRGFTRPVDGDGNGNAACDVGAYETAKQILTGLTPAGVQAGSDGFTLTVTGVNFEDDMIIQWNGTNRPTSFVSNTKIIANISRSDVMTTGLVTVTVVDPRQGGGISNPRTFFVFDTQSFLPLILKN